LVVGDVIMTPWLCRGSATSGTTWRENRGA